MLDYGEFSVGSEGENIHEKLADDERNINYKDLFFKSGNPAISNYDFYKRFGTLYDLLIDLINWKISLRKAAIEQNEIIKKIEELKEFVSLEKDKINKEKNKGAIKKANTKTHARKKSYFITKKCYN